jgi:hypothetical protein
MRRPEAKDFLGKKIVKVDISEPHLTEVSAEDTGA